MADGGFDEVRGRWLAGLNSDERRRREQRLLDKITAMRPTPEPEKLTSYFGLACLSAVLALMRAQSSSPN
jgi:hypothetical protein